jgi:hypothetical protein
LLAGRPKWPKYHKNLEFPGTSILLVFRAGTYFHALNQCFFGSNGNSGALNGHFPDAILPSHNGNQRSMTQRLKILN